MAAATQNHIEEKSEAQRTVSVSDDKENGFSFLNVTDRIQEGDTVIVYVNFGSTYAVQVQLGQSLTMKYGALRHEFIIGKLWGSRLSATAGYIYVLRPSPELWTRSLPRRTQILYSPDTALITELLEAHSGSVIAESGTGSGSLSHALAVAVAPVGHLYTHDIDETRVRAVEAEFKDHGLAGVTTAVVADVCEDGFFVANACDGVFLDLPSPWLAVPHAVRALSRNRGGRLVSFSPCVEQVQRTVQTMREHGFVQVETVEIVPRILKPVAAEKKSLSEFLATGDGPSGGAPRRNRKRRADGEDNMNDTTEQSSAAIACPVQQPTHTGYLISGTLLPRDSVDE